MAIWKTTLASGIRKNHWESDVKFLASAKTALRFQCILLSVKSKSVIGTCFTGIVRDISDLKQAEKELAEANEQLEARVKQRNAELRAAQADLVRSEKFATLGKVSGGIAHEIRNPLNAVKTSAYYLLNAKSPTDEKVREHLERIGPTSQLD